MDFETQLWLRLQDSDQTDLGSTTSFPWHSPSYFIFLCLSFHISTMVITRVSISQDFYKDWKKRCIKSELYTAWHNNIIIIFYFPSHNVISIFKWYFLSVFSTKTFKGHLAWFNSIYKINFYPNFGIFL